jgi:hypothetical protein
MNFNREDYINKYAGKEGAKKGAKIGAVIGGVAGGGIMINGIRELSAYPGENTNLPPTLKKSLRRGLRTKYSKRGIATMTGIGLLAGAGIGAGIGSLSRNKETQKKASKSMDTASVLLDAGSGAAVAGAAVEYKRRKGVKKLIKDAPTRSRNKAARLLKDIKTKDMKQFGQPHYSYSAEQKKKIRLEGRKYHKRERNRLKKNLTKGYRSAERVDKVSKSLFRKSRNKAMAIGALGSAALGLGFTQLTKKSNKT